MKKLNMERNDAEKRRLIMGVTLKNGGFDHSRVERSGGKAL